MAFRALAWVSIPLVGLLFSTAKPLILLYMGTKWAPVVPLFQALAPAAFAGAVSCSLGWVFASWGHVDRQLKWGILQALIMMCVISACVPFGATAVAWGVSGAYLASRLLGFHMCILETPITFGDIGGVMWRPLFLALTACTFGFLISSSISGGMALISELALLATRLLRCACLRYLSTAWCLRGGISLARSDSTWEERGVIMASCWYILITFRRRNSRLKTQR